MQVRDVMSQIVVTVTPQATLEEAARRMNDFEVGFLPVSDDGKQVIGVITDRDLTIRAIAKGLEPKTTKVQSVMTPDMVFCDQDQDIQEAAQLMEQHQVRRLLVFDQEHLLTGIMSLGDLARSAGKELAGEALAATVASR